MSVQPMVVQGAVVQGVVVAASPVQPQQKMMMRPAVGQVAPAMAMPQVVAPDAQIMARAFETSKNTFFEQGVTAWSSGTFDCCADGQDFPTCCGALAVECCCGCPTHEAYWIWYSWITAEAVGEPDTCAKLCCACCAYDYMAGKVVQAKHIREDADCVWCFLWTCCGYCKAWQTRREVAKDPRLRQTLVLYSGTWNQGLLGCMDNPNVCLCVTCCYPCARGNFYAKLGKNCFLYGLCGGPCLSYTRGRVAAAKGIKEGLCEYGMKFIFCGPCMDCQLFAEVEGPGGSPGKYGE